MSQPVGSFITVNFIVDNQTKVWYKMDEECFDVTVMHLIIETHRCL